MSVYTPGNFHTVEDGPWPAGTTVAVWHVSDVVGGVPVGAEIDNGVAGPDGTVTFGGLTEGEEYTAFGHGGTQTFYAREDDHGRPIAALQSPDGMWHELTVGNDGRLATDDVGFEIYGPPPPEDFTALEARVDAVEIGALKYSNAPLAAPNAQIQAKTDPSGTYPDSVIFGNHNSFGFAGTGTPNGIYGALGVHHKFGDFSGGSNAPVLKTTQGLFANVQYWGPTTDDSAQCSNFGVYIKDTGTGFTQAKSVTALEADVQIEGANHTTGIALGMGSRMTALGSSVIDLAYGSKNSLWTRQNKGPGYGSAVEWKGYFDDLYNPAGSTFGVNASVHGKNMLGSEQGLYVNRTGHGGQALLSLHGSGGSTPAMLSLIKPDGATNTAIADGAFTSGSRELTTATAPAPGWIGRTIANANVPAGTQVLNYYGAGPYTVVMTAPATGTASGQAVTFTELDLIGIKVICPATGQAAYEAWATGASNANFRVSRLGAVSSTSNVAVYNSTMAAAQVGIDASGYHVYAAAAESTGAGSAALGANCPAITPTAPFKWFKATSSDGSTVWIPAWK